MSSITTPQTKLDLELVPKENRMNIRNNSKEETLWGDTREAPHFKSFWMLSLSIHAILHFSSLWMSLKYTCTSSGTLYTSMILSTDSRLTRTNNSNLLWKSSEISFRFSKETQSTEEINSLNDVVIDQMHQPWRTFTALINRSLSGMTSGLDKLRLSKSLKTLRVSVKKPLTKPATDIVIREPSVETKSKGKEKEKVDVAHDKGIELLSEVALTKKA
ncbi:hypothetical protein Tco_0797380 [Tanacetum coccineum]